MLEKGSMRQLSGVKEERVINTTVLVHFTLLWQNATDWVIYKQVHNWFTVTRETPLRIGWVSEQGFFSFWTHYPPSQQSAHVFHSICHNLVIGYLPLYDVKKYRDLMRSSKEAILEWGRVDESQPRVKYVQSLKGRNFR